MKEGVQKIASSKSKTFLAFCFSFLFGILAMSFVESRIDFFIPIFVFTLSLIFFICSKPSSIGRLVYLCICAALCGIIRLNFAFPPYDDHQISFYNGQKAKIVVTVDNNPDIRQDGVRYVGTGEEIEILGTKKKIDGKIYFQYSLYPRFQYGEILYMECELASPEPVEEFHYEKYLATKNVFSICHSPTIQTRGEIQGNILLSFLSVFKEKVADHINMLWHEPYASFVSGILYGYRGGLGSLQEDFNRTGVTHIVAVSGFNITIIASILHSFLLVLSFPRKKAFWIITFGIFVFVFFTGASASVVRAGIMGTLGLLAKYFGRRSMMHIILTFTVVLMTLYNPFVLLWDVGFQLSFLSTCGLIYLSPLLEHYFSGIPKFLSIKESLLSTLSAIFFTLPLILFQFGRVSLVAPIVNLLILPLLPFSMFVGFGATFCSFFFSPLSHILSLVTYWCLYYIVSVVHFFSRMSFASFPLQSSFFVMCFLYLLLFMFMYRRYRVV